MADNDYTKHQFEKAVSLMRTHGIISIIFGGLGVLVSIFFMFLFGFTVVEPNDYQIFGAVAMIVIFFVFGVVPSAWHVIAGILLLGNPRPKLAKGIVITNLVVGVFTNLIILIFAIINLTQIGDYERGYKVVKK